LALAQKSKNKVRMGYYDPVSVIDQVYDPKLEPGALGRSVFDPMVLYDQDKGGFRAHLAHSWKRLDKRTYEFKLKKGLKFHDGSELDADDVVYSVNFLSNPKVRFRIKSRFLFIKRAEKVDKYTVRVITKKPAAAAFFDSYLRGQSSREDWLKTKFSEPLAEGGLFEFKEKEARNERDGRR